MRLDDFPTPLEPEACYPHSELHNDIRDVFHRIYLALSEFRAVAADATATLTWHDCVRLIKTAEKKKPRKTIPECLLGWSMPLQFPRGWADDINPASPLWLPSTWPRLRDHARQLQTFIARARRVLYLAEYGPLTSKLWPARLLSGDGKTRFELIADELVEAVNRLEATGVKEWENAETKVGMDRQWILWKFRTTARGMAHEVLLRDASFNVSLIWNDAKLASRELDRSGNEQRVLIDGTWIFERLAILVKGATLVRGIVPVEFPDVSMWAEYASLLDDLIDLAGTTLGKNDRDVIHPLTEISRYAHGPPASADEVLNIDVVAFEAAYNVLRNAVLVEIDKLIPDRMMFRRQVEKPTQFKDLPTEKTKPQEPRDGEQVGRHSMAAMRDWTDFDNKTINKYATLVGVPIAGRGKQDHKFTDAEARSVLQSIIDNCPANEPRNKARTSLAVFAHRKKTH